MYTDSHPVYKFLGCYCCCLIKYIIIIARSRCFKKEKTAVKSSTDSGQTMLQDLTYRMESSGWVCTFVLHVCMFYMFTMAVMEVNESNGLDL